MIRHPFRFGAAFAASVAVAGASVLFAHAKLQKTEPAANATVTVAPDHVSVFFSEAPDAAVSRLSMKGPSNKVKLTPAHVTGKQLMAQIEGVLVDGLYTVEWQTAGDDGHAQKGEFAFTLKRK